MAHKTWCILIGSGKTEQIASNESDVAFLSLGDRPVIAHSLQVMEDCDEIDGVIAVVAKDSMNRVVPLKQMFGFSKLRKVVAGGTTRLTSLQAGLKEIDDEVTIVAVHEVSRPFVHPQVVSESVRVAKRYGAAVAANQLSDTIKIVEKGTKITSTQERKVAWAVQSPQIFKREILEQAIAANKGSIFEESEMLEAIGAEVRVVPSSKLNIKIDSIDAYSFAGVLQRIELEHQQET